jgi:hypothetical protein
MVRSDDHRREINIGILELHGQFPSLPRVWAENLNRAGLRPGYVYFQVVADA